MATMTFVEEMKDKASRIIPTPYTDIVEEATSDLLLTPDYEKIVFICDSANLKEENAVDIVRAVRRRLDNKNPKIQTFTIAMVEALLKNCGGTVHLEMSETKGLLHDLFKCAVKVPSRDGELEARIAGLTLILNMSIWFAGYPDERCKILSALADDVRKVVGEKAFEGIDVQTGVNIRRNVNRPPQQQQQPQPSGQGQMSRAQRRQQEREYARLQHLSQMQQPRVVAAIPLIVPNGEAISGMLDACLLLAECLNTAESSGEPVIGNELIASIATQIRQDHRNLAMIVSSGAELEAMDMLLSVNDSQTAIIQRLGEMVRAQGRQLSEVAGGGVPHDDYSQDFASPTQVHMPIPGGNTASSNAHSDAPPPQASHPTLPAVAPVGGNVGASSSRARPRQALDVEDVQYEDIEMKDTPKIPTMDDLFGQQHAGGAASAPRQTTPPPQAARSSAAPPPYQSSDPSAKVPAEMTRTDAAQAAASVGSLNADNDDFDAFLNNRLQKQ